MCCVTVNNMPEIFISATKRPQCRIQIKCRRSDWSPSRSDSVTIKHCDFNFICLLCHYNGGELTKQEERDVFYSAIEILIHTTAVSLFYCAVNPRIIYSAQDIPRVQPARLQYRNPDLMSLSPTCMLYCW